MLQIPKPSLNTFQCNILLSRDKLKKWSPLDIFYLTINRTFINDEYLTILIFFRYILISKAIGTDLRFLFTNFFAIFREKNNVGPMVGVLGIFNFAFS